MNNIPTQEWVIECLKTVVDPEFPLVDIWTMGLIYQITINSDQWIDTKESDVKVTPSLARNDVEGERDDEGFVSYGDQGQIMIDMTLTTPACPAADYLPEAAKNAVQSMYPEYSVSVSMVRDPTWTIAMIKDEDLKRMFE